MQILIQDRSVARILVKDVTSGGAGRAWTILPDGRP